MKTFQNSNIWIFALILITSASCVSTKNRMLQADEIFDTVTQNMEKIQEADKEKFKKITEFLKLAQNEKLDKEQIKKGQDLFKKTKKNQLNLEKMTSEEIDKYDEITKELMAQLEKIQKLDKNNQALKDSFEAIEAIDDEDLRRRIHYDRAVFAWNKLFKKASRKLQKSKKYKQARSLPVFTIPK